ncbi:hypothetical protein M0R45_018278 [Rubus argutus]|uniref:Uncharacterized protein n=1 Tax=Rubus argutus TaxID=59490 RepID=A0AAW1X3P3_RUBAR
MVDDETQFNGSLGLNVIRGMLELPAEDMHRRGKWKCKSKQLRGLIEIGFHLTGQNSFTILKIHIIVDMDSHLDCEVTDAYAPVFVFLPFLSMLN